MNRLRLILFPIFSLLAVPPLIAQNQNAAGADQQPTFKANVRVVIWTSRLLVVSYT